MRYRLLARSLAAPGRGPIHEAAVSACPIQGNHLAFFAVDTTTTEWLRLRSAERKKELVPVEIFGLAIHELADATLVATSESRAGCFPLTCQNADAAKR